MGRVRYFSKASLGERHKMALALSLSLPPIPQWRIAEMTGFSPLTIQRLKSSPAGSKYLRYLREQADAQAREERIALEQAEEQG